jgi:hypothetical protein
MLVTDKLFTQRNHLTVRPAVYPRVDHEVSGFCLSSSTMADLRTIDMSTIVHRPALRPSFCPPCPRPAL